MDRTDQRLLELLEQDARQSNTDLARKLRISEGTVRNRIERLLKSGAIQRFTVVVGGKSLFRAIVLLDTQPSMPTDSIIAELSRMKEIKKFLEVSGEWDVAMEVTCPTSERFNQVIERIRTTRGVLRTESLVVLKIS
ncbi:MAG: Lrp/AsnC family transcriptional regulator [Candidatus Aenigmarchaeota archaeon]|nr:Lrp/AsnC family transcriptional regulator [Candidatus Aenigmarchaeota archaeon]